MKKLIVTSAIFALLALPLVAAMPALAADVTFDADTTLDLSNPDVDIIVRNGTTVDSITPSAGTISITMSTGETLTLRSNDRKSMSHNSSFASSFTCADSYSELTITGGTGSNTFTVSVSSGTCSTANSGSVSSSPSPAPSTTPAPTTATETTPAAAETTEATEAAEATTETTPAETTTAKTTTAEGSATTETTIAPASEFAQKIVDIISEASEVIAAKMETFAAKVGATRDLTVEENTTSKYINPLLKDDNTERAVETLNPMLNFVAYGTPTTKVLGAGERAGVLNSFKKAYSKLPETEVDWQDTIKIANGRFPKQQSIEKEKEALKTFGKIYKKMPDFKNSHDEAALKIFAYGIRPTSRNLNSEKFAIKTFKSIYGRNPSDTADWDVMRAIAYSGAKR